MYQKSESILTVKSKAFAVRIVSLYKYIKTNYNENILSKQLLRSGTSIGANISESTYAQSSADFITKLYIALKEASETKYWIELLSDTNYITKDMKETFLKECEEIIRMLISSIKTTKKHYLE